ncbi:DUF1365 domain-containing protein [Dokdonella sp.]|uniref:DUF1365 domain-containing protein n=1 Tax=Dokdonella sp. TaxID=2291710 RepID=UPI002F406EAB
MSAALASCVYEGVVRHRRHAPSPYAFRHRMAQLFLDLDELDRVFDDRWFWSTRHANLAQFRRSDYLAPTDIPLAEAVRRRIAAHGFAPPQGAIRVLTHLRYFGHVFNPVSLYYCHDDAGALEVVLAEITNTPWRERHAYVLPVADAERRGRALRWEFDKRFHVSPFLPLDRRYHWTFTPPDADLRVRMDVVRDGQREFDADLALRRRSLDGRSLARVLVRYPAMTVQVLGAIHWHALRLWLKRNPVYDHPTQSRGAS